MVSLRSTARRSIRSSKRPGVATNKSTPRSNREICGLIDTPPTTICARRLVPWQKPLRFSIIWLANSRVGASTRPRTVRGRGRPVSSIICATKGTPKAAVFPVPVCARPITSRPFNACGMACFWIGVGSFRPICANIPTNRSGRPIISKSLIVVFLGRAAAAHRSCERRRARRQSICTSRPVALPHA